MNEMKIGGADGPTSIFLVGELNAGWLNVFGLIIVVIMLIPNIIYAIKFRGAENCCSNKLMNNIEQIGRYASMFFMIFNIGILEFGFASVQMFIAYMLGNIILMAAYWIVWILYFIRQRYWKSMTLAVIPTLIFLLCGIALRDWMLVISGGIFGIGHVYVTYQNGKK